MKRLGHYTKSECKGKTKDMETIKFTKDIDCYEGRKKFKFVMKICRLCSSSIIISRKLIR